MFLRLIYFDPLEIYVDDLFAVLTYLDDIVNVCYKVKYKKSSGIKAVSHKINRAL